MRSLNVNSRCKGIPQRRDGGGEKVLATLWDHPFFRNIQCLLLLFRVHARDGASANGGIRVVGLPYNSVKSWVHGFFWWECHCVGPTCDGNICEVDRDIGTAKPYFSGQTGIHSLNCSGNRQIRVHDPGGSCFEELPLVKALLQMECRDE